MRERVKAPTIQAADDWRELLDGFFPLVAISSDGKSFYIRIPEQVIPLINEECIERMLDCLRDCLYRMRPDLRKQ